MKESVARPCTLGWTADYEFAGTLCVEQHCSRTLTSHLYQFAKSGLSYENTAAVNTLALKSVVCTQHLGRNREDEAKLWDRKPCEDEV